MIQHDCGHGSLFRHRLANDWVGRMIGALTLTPYDFGGAATLSITQARAISTGAVSATSTTLTVASIRICRWWRGCAIGCIAIRSSCSASARPIFSFCSTGCRSA